MTEVPGFESQEAFDARAADLRQTALAGAVIGAAFAIEGGAVLATQAAHYITEGNPPTPGWVAAGVVSSVVGLAFFGGRRLTQNELSELQEQGFTPPVEHHDSRHHRRTYGYHRKNSDE